MFLKSGMRGFKGIRLPFKAIFTVTRPNPKDLDDAPEAQKTHAWDFGNTLNYIIIPGGFGDRKMALWGNVFPPRGMGKVGGS